MYTKRDYESAFASFKQHNPSIWPRYATPNAETLLLEFLAQNQRIPSVTTVQIALDDLVRRNVIFRVDGKTEADDAQELRAGLQQNLDRALADAEKSPLTKDELDHFASLSFSDLQRLYWGSDGTATDYFSARYRKAAREQGYRIPTRPVAEENISEDGAVELTAAQYHALPANVLKQKLRNPRFELAVRQLIRKGEI